MDNVCENESPTAPVKPQNFQLQGGALIAFKQRNGGFYIVFILLYGMGFDFPMYNRDKGGFILYGRVLFPFIYIHRGYIPFLRQGYNIFSALWYGYRDNLLFLVGIQGIFSILRYGYGLKLFFVLGYWDILYFDIRDSGF